MAEIIKVSTEQMQSTLNTYNTQKGVQTSAYESMRSTIAQLEASWQGSSAQAFQSKFQEFYRNIAQSEAKMADAVDELAKSAQLYTTAEDERVKASVGNLEVGRSPFA